jgi:cholesterol oxidase
MKKISRRSFLMGSAAGLAAVSFGVRSWAQDSEPVPALVIGSGFGGAVAALRLAQAGIQTVVLERGIRWPITPAQDTFATFENPDGRAGWLRMQTISILPPAPIAKFTGVLEQIDTNNISVLAGAGVGGGSLVYNGITLQPRRELFQRVFPPGIDFDQMDDVFYPRVLSVLGASEIPPDILATPFYLSTRVNLQQAEQAGFFFGKFAPTAVDWDIVRQEINGTRRPSAIAGESWYGLNSGAKRSLDHNYLRMAEETGKVQILTLHLVTDIIAQPSQGLFLVRANVIDTNGNVLRTANFACRHLFMAAGSMGTSSLLVRAKAKGTLPRLSSTVGQGWGSNGDFLMIRAGLGTNNSGTGGPAGHFLLEDPNNPFSPSNAIELVTPKNDAQQGITSQVGLGLPPAAGTFTFDPATNSVTLNWPAPTDPLLAPFINGANSMLNSLNAANPGSVTVTSTPTVTGHPLGGATAGRACDLFGRVLGYSGLFVVDGAFVPGGSTAGVNPSFTIAALAERNMEEIIAKDILGE